MSFGHIYLVFFKNNPKNLDLSYKTDLVLWDCYGKVKLVLQQNYIGLFLVICSHSREGKTPFYSQTNSIHRQSNKT